MERKGITEKERYHRRWFSSTKVKRFQRQGAFIQIEACEEVEQDSRFCSLAKHSFGCASTSLSRQTLLSIL